MYPMNYLWRLGRSNTVYFQKTKRDSIYFCILRRHETGGIIYTIINATQSTTHDLLAEQLSRKCANAKNVSDGICIPSFGKHGNGNYAFDIFTKFAWLTDRIHHFSQKFFIGWFFAARKTFAIFFVKIFNFFCKNPFEFVTYLIAAFNLRAINEQRIGTI